jgi:hypothetical protein
MPVLPRYEKGPKESPAGLRRRGLSLSTQIAADPCQRQRADATEEKVAERLVPTAVIVEMMTTQTSAAIMPYSIAVAPLSSRIMLDRVANMLATPNEEPLEFMRDRQEQSR